MALPDISLAEFNRIASGEYNAGQIDFETDRNGGVSLVKVNNHIHQTSKNNVTLDRQRILDVKEAFIAALERGGVKADSIKEIRANLGLPVDFSASEDAAAAWRRIVGEFRLGKSVEEASDSDAPNGGGFLQV